MARLISSATLAAVLTAVTALAACDGSGPPEAEVSVESPVTAVSCGDAEELKARARKGHQAGQALKSDQEKIYVSGRASFFASLAIIAELKCKAVVPDTDEALKPAFAAARRAEDTRSMYERALAWGEADYAATQVIEMMLAKLPVSTSN